MQKQVANAACFFCLRISGGEVFDVCGNYFSSGSPKNQFPPTVRRRYVIPSVSEGIYSAANNDRMAGTSSERIYSSSI